MSLTLNEIHVNGVKEPGRVIMSFGNTDLNMDVATTRNLAKALNDQADIAELEGMREETA